MYLQSRFDETFSGLGACAVPASVTLRRLVCTAADRTAIGMALGLGRDATAAEVRTIITDAVRRAVVLITQASAPLRRPRAVTAAGEIMRLRFRDAFGTAPEFIPTWRPAGQTWDRGAVVRERLRCAAKIMLEGDIEFVCWGPGSCPFAFAWDPGTWAVVLPGQYRICLGARFWRASREGDVDRLATTMLHECLHIYFNTIRHELERGPYNTAACYERYVHVANGLPVPAAVSTPCPSGIPRGDFPLPHPGADRIAGLGWFGQPTAAVSALGQELWQEAPAGVTVAIYYADPEQKRRAIEWAARERAIGPRVTRITASDLMFGKAILDSGSLGTQLTQLASALSTAVAAVPQPSSITPLPGTGPSLIRTLALFTHGTNTWVSIGGSITNSNAAKMIKRIAPTLTDDVKIILYGCSSARGQSEASSWVNTTTSSGGDDSLAARIRDALVDAGKTRATVWGHTEVGHTTRNPSLREFGAARGKGTVGQSYLDETVFGALPDAMVREAIAETIEIMGFVIPEARQDAFRTAAGRHIKRLRYSCYVGAVVHVRTVAGKQIKETNLTFREANLPEMAPLYPLDVADIIRRRWSDVCWTQAVREQAARQLIKDLKLKRQGQLHTTP